MSLTSTDIARIANLARLDLAPDESERMLTKINGFFNMVEKMRAVDTRSIEPMAHPVDANTAGVPTMALRLRDDLESEPNRRDANQQSAPAVENGLFLVPKVIE
jgi:aspartyl-tRNA(Asn)/glutamyl-tRNA(Gln) amidotransferase subunit C